MSAFAASWLNFGLLVGLMAWKLRAPVKDFVRSRADTLENEITRVRGELSRARAQFDEYSGRLQAIDAELASVREDARQQSQQIRERILGEATRLAAVTLADARESSVAAVDGFRKALASEIGVQILDRVEQLVTARLTGDDRVRMRKEFSRWVGASR